MSKSRHGEPRVRALASRYPDGFELGAHAHDWGQLLYAIEGVMLVESSAGTWVVPPHRAVWLPAGTEHRVTMRGSVAMRTVYLERRMRVPLDGACVVDVPPLLRELVAYVAGRGKLDVDKAHDARLCGLLVDLLAQVPTVPVELPMPRDARAERVARAVRANPAKDPLTRAGASRRTIERLFVAETGMTFGRWRQQARLVHALCLLAAGHSVTAVALEVGYSAPSAFVAMFKSALGTTPGRFFTATAW
jgi:AraC-like DNA-binding protein